MANSRNAKARWPDEEMRAVIQYFQIVEAPHLVGILEWVYARSRPLTWPRRTKNFGLRYYITKYKGRKAAGGLSREERKRFGLIPPSWLDHPDRDHDADGVDAA